MDRKQYLREVEKAGIGSSPSYSVSYHGENCIPLAYRLSISDTGIQHEAMLETKKKELITIPLEQVEPFSEETERKEREQREKEKLPKPERTKNIVVDIPKEAFQYEEYHFLPAFSFPTDEEGVRKRKLAPLDFYLSIDLELGYFPITSSIVKEKRRAVYEENVFLSKAGGSCEENIFYCVEREKYYCPKNRELFLYNGPAPLPKEENDTTKWTIIAIA